MLTSDQRDELAVLQAVHDGPAALARLLDPTYLDVPHQSLISREIAAGVRSDGRRWLMIHTPPQVGKTVTALTWGAFWALVEDPAAQVMIVSYSDMYAVRRGAEVRDLIDQHGERFGLRLKRRSSSKKDFRLESGGQVYSASLSGSLTGMSGTTVLIDDYIRSRTDADSPIIRSRTHSLIGTSVLSRISPTAFVAIISTLWHPREASQILLDEHGRAEDGGKWRVIRLPAIADSPDDPLGRAIGDPLLRVDQRLGRVTTPAEARAWWAHQELGTGTRDYAAMYQAKFIADGASLLTPEQVDAAYDMPRSPMVYQVIAIDPSDADSLDATGHDRTGIAHVGRDAEGVVWLLGDYSVDGPVEAWSRRAVDLADILNVDEIVYERNKGGRAVGLVLQSSQGRKPRRRPPPRIVDVTATTSKITRASPIAQMIITGGMRFARNSPTSLSTVAQQFTTYQPGGSDSPDEMDAAVWGATRAYRPPVRAVDRSGPSQWELLGT